MSDRTRSINDLRVIDLRVELEKRSLDKSGVRNVLIERLTKHLVEEGHDPATFKFELSGSEPKTPAKRPRRSESTVEQAEDETPAMEDMIVQDHVGDEEEAEPKADNSIESTEKIPEEKMEVDDAEKSNRKRENKDEPEATVAKKPCLDSNDSKTEEDNKALENNADAEDSINLDINEDELLNDEAEGTTKINKIDVASFAKTGAAMEDDDNTGGGADTAADSASTDAQQEVDAEVPATSNGSEEDKDNDQKDDKDENGDKKKDDGKEGGARNLWVSGLSGDTRAKDLKQLCSKHGKVIGAKVVTNARTPGSRCYGYVTMGSAQDAENCIKNLHRTELHGRMISVEKAKSESESTTRRSVPARPERRSSSDRKDDKDKTNEDGKENAEKVVDGKTEPSGADSTRSTSRSREKSHRSEKDYDTTDEKIWKNSGVVRRNNHQARENCSFCHDMNHTLYKCRAFGDMTSADRKTWAYTNGKCFRCLRDHFTRDCESKSWCKFCKSTNHNSMICSQEPHGQRPQKERDLARERERSRAAREEVRRRRAAEDALRERERRQRQEKHRLAIEKEKLRAEREKIEREKNELLRLERERHRLEREKLELERMELKRAQLRLEEERRKRSGYEGGAYRKAPSPPPAPAYERDPRDPRDPRHKRPPPPPMSSHRQFEAPPPPRFEMPAPAYERDKRDRERDYKRDYPRHVSSSNVKYPTNGSSNDDSRQPLPPGTRPKEPSRAYDARDSRAYRPSPPGKPEPRAWPPSRYVDSAAPPKGKGGSTSEGWGGSGGGASGGGGGGSAGEARYGSGYEARYTPAYQPPPPGASYPDRYQAPREYRKY